MTKKNIVKFEHEKLTAKELKNPEVLHALQRYHGSDGTPFFSLIHHGIKFNQYVGIIQVGGHTIEVLPKVDKISAHTNTWRDALVQMLRITTGIEAKSTSSSSLRILPNSILDLYVELFISECERLVYRGLIKRYRRKRENRRSLKGRLDLPEQIKQNIIHKERFYVDYSSYDQDHLINQIVKKTLYIIRHLTIAPNLKSRLKRILLYFEDISDLNPTESDFNKVRYGRKNVHYKRALQIARLILLNYHPDIRSGQQDVLALMFDMNDLWERYVALQIQRNLNTTFYVKAQKSEIFWESESSKRRLRPDILLSDKKDQNRQFVIDTKWKMPPKMQPSVSDVRQMFAYNQLYNCSHSILLYPGNNERIIGEFQIKDGGKCSVMTWNIFDSDSKLRNDSSLATEIVEYLTSESLVEYRVS